MVILKLRLADLFDHLINEIQNRLQMLMSLYDAFIHHIIRNLISLGLDHDNLLVCCGNRGRHTVGLSLLSRRVKEIFLSVPAEDDAGDRPIERHIGNRNCCRSTDHSGNLRGAVTVNRKHFTGNDNIVAKIGGEKRTHRAVNQAGSKHCGKARLAFAALEAAGNTADCVEFLIKVNRKREVINPILRAGRSCACYEDNGLSVCHKNGCIAKFCQFADFHRELAAFVIHFKLAVIGEFSVLDNHFFYSLHCGRSI